MDYVDYDSSLGEDPYSKSRSFDEDYSSGHKKNSRNEVLVPHGQPSIAKRSFSTDRSLNYGRRLYEHNLICPDQNSLYPNSGTGVAMKNNNVYRNRSPLMMQFRPDAQKHSSSPRDQSPVSGDEAMEPNENEQFYHLKKLLSNANLQNNKNYQYTKSKSAKRHPLQSTESLTVGENAHFANSATIRNRSPMLSKRTESLHAPNQAPATYKARPAKPEIRRPGVPATNSAGLAPHPVSSGRY